MRWCNWTNATAEQRHAALERPGRKQTAELQATVSSLVDDVRQRGDAALLELTARLDGVELEALEVTDSEWQRAAQGVSAQARAAIRRAREQLERFHAAQKHRPIDMEVSPGVRCQRVARPIARIGLYAPGGTAPLPSTVLMLGVPAAIAANPVRVLCTPPDTSGGVEPHILAAAHEVGIQRVFKLGGAQAIAAMAYGTKTVPKVDKIYGPGNAWVTEAKAQCARDPQGAALDLPAGPSEVLVVADASARAEFVAADLLSQAEHGRDSQVVLVTTDDTLAKATREAIDAQLQTLPRRHIAAAALEQGAVVRVASVAEGMEVANAYAPEHLILHLQQASQWVEHVQHAGSVFVGPWSPEAIGDYASGTNHVLPTYGFARTLSGLSVDDFVRHMTVQELTPGGLEELGPSVETLAHLEGLDAHRQAVSVRRRALHGESQQ